MASIETPTVLHPLRGQPMAFTFNSPLIASLFVATLLAFITWFDTESAFPTINVYPWDLLRRKAYREYMQNAAGLTAEGSAKFQGPFNLYTPNGPRLILPPALWDWIKDSKDVDHQQLVQQDFFASYSGFDAQRFITNPDRLLIDVVRLKLSRNAQSITIMDEYLHSVLKDTWTDRTDWHLLDWPQDTMKIISHMSASVFAGPELASNEAWHKLTMTYTVNVFGAVGALRRWPAFMRSMAHLFLPESRVCREQAELARQLVQPVLDQRAREKASSTSKGRDPPQHPDCLTWMEEVAAGRPFDPVAGQLALALAALHTTTEAFRQVLLDLCSHPDLIEPLRHEIQTALSESGPTLAALAKMELLDSVMKESQRLLTASVGVERLVTRTTALPDGTLLPRGTTVALDATAMAEPPSFDGRRFLALRRQGDPGAAFASSTRAHSTFGASRFVCPGRFLVADEIKLALARVLLMYDVRWRDPEGGKTRVRSGFYVLTDGQAQVEVRRRAG